MKSFLSKFSWKVTCCFSILLSFCVIAYIRASEKFFSQDTHFFWPIDDQIVQNQSVDLPHTTLAADDSNPFEENLLAQEENEIPDEELDSTESDYSLAENYALLFPHGVDENEELTSNYLIYEENLNDSNQAFFDSVEVNAQLAEVDSQPKIDSCGYRHPHSNQSQPHPGSPCLRKDKTTVIGKSNPTKIEEELVEESLNEISLSSLFNEEEDLIDSSLLPEGSALKSAAIKASVQKAEVPKNVIGSFESNLSSPGSEKPIAANHTSPIVGIPQQKSNEGLDGTHAKVEVITIQSEKAAPLGVGHPEYEPFFPAGFQGKTKHNEALVSTSLGRTLDAHNDIPISLTQLPISETPSDESKDDQQETEPQLPPADTVAQRMGNILDGVAAKSFQIVEAISEYIGYNAEQNELEKSLNPGSKGPWPNQDLTVKENIGKKAPQKPLLALASTLLAQNDSRSPVPENIPNENILNKSPGEPTPSPEPRTTETNLDLSEPKEEDVQDAETPTAGEANASDRPVDQPSLEREPGSTQGVLSTPQPAGPPRSQDQPITPPPTAKEGFLINFANVSIVEYINFISRITGKNFVFDPGDLDFRVTIVSNEPTSVSNIMAALLQELRIHDLALMEIGNNLIIHRNPKANSPATVVSDGSPSIRNQELITRVYHLTNTSAEQIVPVIKPMLSAFALVEAVENSGHLIVTDLTSNIEKINVLVKSLDAPTSDLEIGQFHVSYASAEEVVNLADKILAPIAQGKTLTFVPHTPTNSVFIISTPYLVEKAISVLHQVDVPQGQGTTRILTTTPPSALTPQAGPPAPEPTPLELQSGRLVPEPSAMPEAAPTSAGRWTSNLPLGHVESTRFFIRKLHYRRGDQIVDALRRIGESLQFTGGYSPETAIQNTDLITTINSVQWLEASNSLIYTGTMDSIIRLTQLIDEIDIPVRQVLIEMLVLETNVDDAIEFSVDWGSRFGGLDTAGSQAFLSQGSPLVAALDTTQIGSIPNASGLARSAGFSSGVIGRRVTHGGAAFQSLGILVSALHADLRNEVIMNPKVVVEDNTPAEVFVGLEARFQTQTIANDFGTILTSNFEYRDVGATLRVTPLIGSDDMITLDVEMEITTLITQSLVVGSNVVNQTAEVLNQANLVQVVPVERKSRTISKIHLPNKYFVVLSGMLQDEMIRVRNNLPCLGGVPVIGAMFANKSTANIRRNLMLFIRPQIIDPEDIDPVTKRQQDIYREKGRQQKAWEYEVNEALWFFNLKHICDPDEKEATIIPRREWAE